MSRKYQTRCWLCGSTDLEPDAKGMVCKACGATYSILPKPGSDILTLREDKVLNMPSLSPSASLMHRVAKARQSKAN